MNPPDRPRADLPPRSRIRGLARHVLPDAPTGSRTPRRVGPQIRMPGNLHAKILSRKSREDERSQAKNAYEPGWDARQRFLFVSRIATNYLVKEPFHTQWKREPSTQSQSQSQSLVPGHSTLPILHQDAWHALACLSDPNAPIVQHGPVHRDRWLSHHPGCATETSSRYMPILSRSVGSEAAILKLQF
jgi:hypothetical protein